MVNVITLKETSRLCWKHCDQTWFVERAAWQLLVLFVLKVKHRIFLAKTKLEPAFISLRHFGHLSHNSIKTRRNSVR